MKQIIVLFTMIIGAASLLSAPTMMTTTNAINYTYTSPAPTTNITEAQYWFEMGKLDSAAEKLQGMLNNLDQKMLGMSSSDYLANNP
jgi:hypothetical protein